MANTKISALSSATTPLSGSEIVPINQSGTTDSVTVANLTAGRAVSAASLALTSSPLPTSSGGTGLTSFTSGGVVYASSTSALATGSSLAWDGNNLGLTGTPSSWASNVSAIQQGNTGIYKAGSGVLGNILFLSSNSYYNGTNDIYQANYSAAKYQLGLGQHYWYTASSGTAGNTVSYTQVWSMDSGGNFIQGVAGKGINFTAITPASGMTSQNLNWYEEGTWTPTFTNLTIVGTPTYTGKYTRIGRMVSFTLRIKSTTSTSSSAGATYFNQPIVQFSNRGTLTAANGNASASYGVGLIADDGNCYLPTWVTVADVSVSGFYFV